MRNILSIVRTSVSHYLCHWTLGPRPRQDLTWQTRPRTKSGPISLYNRKTGMHRSPTPDFPYHQVLRSINVLKSLTHALMTTMITFVFRCLRAPRTSPADHEAGPRPVSPEASQKGHTATERSPESPGLILGTREEIFCDSQQPLLLC